MNDPQPLDALMNKLNISNADLVKASTEQLSFKMVNKGRAGNRRLSPNVQDKILTALLTLKPELRRLSPNVQDKILTALLTLKPELKLRRRDLFCYEIDEMGAGRSKEALDRKSGVEGKRG